MIPEGGEAVMTNQVGPRGETVLSERISSSQHQEWLQRIEDMGSFGHLWYVKYGPCWEDGTISGLSVCSKESLVFGTSFIPEHRDSVSSMGCGSSSFGLGENKCYGLGLGLDLI